MSRSVSWTDADSVALLLARATGPRRAAARPALPKRAVSAKSVAPKAATKLAAVEKRASARPTAVENPAKATPSTRVGNVVDAAKQSIEVKLAAPDLAAIRSTPAAVAPVPPVAQTSDNPSDRLDTLLAWALDHQQCTGAFVADDNGLTLAAHGVSEAHVSLVGPLLSSLVAVRSVPGVDASAGALWLGENMMSWVETRTTRGGFCLGTVGAEALSSEALEQLKAALETTVQGL